MDQVLVAGCYIFLNRFCPPPLPIKLHLVLPIAGVCFASICVYLISILSNFCSNSGRCKIYGPMQTLSSDDVMEWWLNEG